MPTTPTAYAEVVRFSKDSAALRSRVISLYRKFTRSAPEFIEMYEIRAPVAEVRTRLRAQFEQNRFVQDQKVRNILLLKGQQEFQETINFWKQQCHVLRLFDDLEETIVERPTNDFVRRFIKNTA